jgi:bifunctional UDP-N-acetylglucosamine pyrophosphorylase/glucosamine-1-phosphate N-acetyltransferase
MSDLHVIVLAAGLGTRMKSDRAKVLHQVAGRPLVLWPVELAQAVGASRIVAVLGHQLGEVKAILPPTVTVVRQEKQLGTGDAVRQALPALAASPDDDRVLILSGDVPLVTRQTIDQLLAAAGEIAFVTTIAPDPKGYGRVVRSPAVRIVEEKDASDAERSIKEINAGIYAVRLGYLRRGVEGLRADNAQKELYLTDLVRGDAATVEVPFDEVAGVNDRVDLARVDALARRKVAERWMREGVTILAPETVSIDADVAIGRDTEIHPHVTIRGKTVIGARARIDVGCVLTDVEIGDGTLLKPYCVLAQTRVGARAQVGPFTHCRPDSVLGDEVHVGNFVEVKKSRLGPGTKANHLAYLGDAVIGAKVNVGAGVITCNYDGKNKFQTVIDDGAFVGSDVQLVAPVTVGQGAFVGAGTTVTGDVPPGALAISRAPFTVKEGWADKKRK